MKLYVDHQYASPYAMSAFVGLREKGVAFEMEALDLASAQQHADDYVRRSLTHRVPTLVEGDFNLSESSAIVEYLDDTLADPALLPRTPRERARARQVQAWLRSDLGALREARSTVVVFYRPSPEPLAGAARDAADKLIAAAGQLLDHGGEHLFGDWCIADTDLALMLNRLVLNGDPVPEQLARYAADQWQRPSVQAWVQLPRPPL